MYGNGLTMKVMCIGCRFLWIVLLFLQVFLVGIFQLAAQKNPQQIAREEYIRIYKPVVKQKMMDFGIPASIAMAQAIAESGNGNSTLAKKANNHFGIKCHGWAGETFHWDDDEENECFRKYRSAEESFHDHSLFLTMRLRYAKLFELDASDYRAWAHGLYKAGYATNPHYADMLIRIIEENQLYDLDNEVINGFVLAEKPGKEFDDRVFASADYEEFGPGKNSRTLFLNNWRLFVFARPDDTYFKIANDFDINLAKLCSLNDVAPGTRLHSGAMVYIERKRRRSKKSFHTVQGNESMHDISQLYGIRLKNLYRINDMEEGSEPAASKRVLLR
jgi:hypothetical protein